MDEGMERTIGQILREERERRQVTPSQAAAQTRIKVQHIEAMERSDFSPMAAPTYAKGFIRIYSEYLGLDPAPLIEMYVASAGQTTRPEPSPQVLEADDVPKDDPSPSAESGSSEPVSTDASSRVRWIAAAVGVVIIAVGLAALSRSCAGRSSAKQAREEEEAPSPTTVVEMNDDMLLRQPPDPYITSIRGSEASP